MPSHHKNHNTTGDRHHHQEKEEISGETDDPNNDNDEETPETKDAKNWWYSGWYTQVRLFEYYIFILSEKSGFKCIAKIILGISKNAPFDICRWRKKHTKLYFGMVIIDSIGAVQSCERVWHINFVLSYMMSRKWTYNVVMGSETCYQSIMKKYVMNMGNVQTEVMKYTVHAR